MGGLQAKSMTSQRYRAVTRWRLCVTILHLQQYSHRLNLFVFYHLCSSILFRMRNSLEKVVENFETHFVFNNFPLPPQKKIKIHHICFQPSLVTCCACGHTQYNLLFFSFLTFLTHPWTWLQLTPLIDILLEKLTVPQLINTECPTS